jgi:hypothetical protein
VSRTFVRKLASFWTGKLSHYRLHQNDEHVLALVEEASRYSGLHLENELSRSPFWSRKSLIRQAAVLLFFVDRGIVDRTHRQGRRVFEPLPHAEAWVLSQPTLRHFHHPMLELISALRRELIGRVNPRQS